MGRDRIRPTFSPAIDVVIHEGIRGTETIKSPERFFIQTPPVTLQEDARIPAS